MFQDLVADDVAAYGFYQEQARRDDSDPQKGEAVQLALAAAISVPKEMGKLALALLEDLRELEGRCNPWLISDLVAGAALAVATVSLCDFNVRINVPNLTDKAAAADLHKGSASDLARALALQAEINEAAKHHLP
jgi:formiminotetrahydrofolate cyclodeaminase